ncbi:IclR family transcriptional regulator [Alicyclobacillus dauci]|uniref:IclR family transcriptional regulator n=1 Tax=Alicyclobacillus dauci TaxID=1475485 RepID=A0ABY6Z934_9BACL|nr:IclR family transcriptional regulator [Alicyclobacillus dauci]WAH36341.1 IclR family transcriptional regulator [Alicyclobacillus dauci]WAH39390.1 IclR family transcriptional regulator [Alicyclobacillus dauci]
MKSEMTGLGIQSLEIGLSILKEISTADVPLSITEISERCNMPKSKLHRYLTSLYRTGFLKRDANLLYTLGEEFYSIGLKALGNLNIRQQAGPTLTRLRERLNETVALSIWTEEGPHFIHWEESLRAVNVGIRVGSQVSALKTAGGKVFLAFLPKDETEHVVQKELKEHGISRAAFEEEMASIRKRGFATTEGSLLQGIASVACPLFGRNNSVVASITIVGILGYLQTEEDSEVVDVLKEECLALSKTLL